MKKFFALLKVSVKAMLLTSSGVGAGRRRRAASGVGAVLLIAFLGLYLSGMYSFMLVDVLAPVGMESLVLVFMGLVALLGGLLFTVFAVRGVLFGGKDNDLMLSLPVPASMLVASHGCSPDMPKLEEITEFIRREKELYGEMIAVAK